MKATKYIINNREYSALPHYLEKDGFMRPVTPENFTIESVEYDIPSVSKEEIALSKTIFTQRQIRLAMRALGNEGLLNTLLQNPKFAQSWSEVREIDLNDPETQEALALVAVDIDAVKLAIAGILPE